MNLGYIILVVLMAISYYLFSHQFFVFSVQMSNKTLSFKTQMILFLVIYFWFLVASMMELPLIVNWLFFMIFLGLEIQLVLKFDFLIAYSISMFCTIIGLASNIFFRSLVAIVLKLPLSTFDNMQSSIKAIPICSGFLFMALLFLILRHFDYDSKLKSLLHNKKSLIFYISIEGCIYLFLIIQLLTYSQAENSIIIKLWGIKSAFFSIIILIIANIYALRVASLNHYMEKEHEIHYRLIQEKENINNLWALAYTDMLTKCNNRHLLDKRLEEYAGYGGQITLAFIDLNGLKLINDQFGHLSGDQYLKVTVDILLELCKNLNVDLFRYGGDEFVLMSNSLDVSVLNSLLIEANLRLRAHHDNTYAKSISYGIVCGDSTDYHQLMRTADELMYQYKIQHYGKMKR